MDFWVGVWIDQLPAAAEFSDNSPVLTTPVWMFWKLAASAYVLPRKTHDFSWYSAVQKQFRQFWKRLKIFKLFTLKQKFYHGLGIPAGRSKKNGVGDMRPVSDCKFIVPFRTIPFCRISSYPHYPQWLSTPHKTAPKATSNSFQYYVPACNPITLSKWPVVVNKWLIVNFTLHPFRFSSGTLSNSIAALVKISFY